MKLLFLTPRPELRSYLSQIWIFESPAGFSNQGTLIAPNAKPKIIFPYLNNLSTTDKDKTEVCKEADIWFIGVRDMPVTLGSSSGATGSIGVELTTSGAYHFLSLPFSQLTNTLFSFTDLYGKKGEELLEKLFGNKTPFEKVETIQQFLLDRLYEQQRSNGLIDYSVRLISSSKGLLEIKELERKTGYSKRYLDMLFKEYVGISPKTYSTIVRFQSFYKNISQEKLLPTDSIYELYYDQSHFIKEFKRFTGKTPMQYSGFKNDFGRNF